MDNNVAASSRYKEVIAEIRDLGFQSGALFERPDLPPVKRRVDFNQGVDARILSKTPMYLKEMATICVDPLRIAFDHIGMRRAYERAVQMAAGYGLRSLSNYMLYNFMDTPSDLYQRMSINIELNERLGVRIWSFPNAVSARHYEGSVTCRQELESLLSKILSDNASSHTWRCVRQ